MTAIEKAKTLMDKAAAQRQDEARDLARRAWDEFDRARLPRTRTQQTAQGAELEAAQNREGGKVSAKTPADRQRDRTERLARDGLKRVPVIVPVELEGEIKMIAQIMRQTKPATERNT